MISNKYIVRVGSTAQNGTSATVSITSAAIEFPKTSRPWSINVWFTSLAWSGTAPTVTLEVSNSADVNSFNALTLPSGGLFFTAPDIAKSKYSKWRYFRVVYDAQGASAGTKNFDLIVEP